MKSWLTLIFNDFNRLGQQTSLDEADVEWMSEGEIKRWIYHSGSNSRRYPQVTTYAYGVFIKEKLEQLKIKQVHIKKMIHYLKY